MAQSRRARRAMALVAVAGTLADQGSKYLVVHHLQPGHPVRLLGGLLSLDLIRNPGAAFSMGTGATVAITCLAIAATVAMLVVVAPRVRTTGQGALAGMATAGIVGNLADRLFRAPGVMRGHVVDFFHLPHFAIFNVADIFITCTAVLLVLAALRGDRSDRPAAVDREEETR